MRLAVELYGDGRLALSINGQYRHRDVSRSDLVAEVRHWGVRRADAPVVETLGRIREVAVEEEPLPGAYRGLRADVLGFTERLLADRR